MTQSKITHKFDSAAAAYDQTAEIQKHVAQSVVDWASTKTKSDVPQTILDVGCGTGLVLECVLKKWPEAHISGLDAALAMLTEAKKKFSKMTPILENAATAKLDQKFDLIFSSMALHWLSDPISALRLWRSWLNPSGKLFVALPVDGSFLEWKNICSQSGVADGLWKLPQANFAAGLCRESHEKIIKLNYSSVAEFLHSMKKIGAATSRPEHKAMTVPEMRQLINASPRPMSVTYHLVFLELSAISGS